MCRLSGVVGTRSRSGSRLLAANWFLQRARDGNSLRGNNRPCEGDALPQLVKCAHESPKHRQLNVTLLKRVNGSIRRHLDLVVSGGEPPASIPSDLNEAVDDPGEVAEQLQYQGEQHLPGRIAVQHHSQEREKEA